MPITVKVRRPFPHLRMCQKVTLLTPRLDKNPVNPVKKNFLTFSLHYAIITEVRLKSSTSNATNPIYNLLFLSF